MPACLGRPRLAKEVLAAAVGVGALRGRPAGPGTSSVMARAGNGALRANSKRAGAASGSAALSLCWGGSAADGPAAVVPAGAPIRAKGRFSQRALASVEAPGALPLGRAAWPCLARLRPNNSSARLLSACLSAVLAA